MTSPVRARPLPDPPARPVPGVRGALGGPPPPLPRTTVDEPWERATFLGSPPTTAAGEPDRARDLPRSPGMAQVPDQDPATWCGSLVRAAVEVLLGARPAAQLTRWLTAGLYDQIARHAGLARRISGAPLETRSATVRRVHLCRLDATTAEASVVVHDGEHVRAAAVRVEAFRGRWRAVALEIY